MPRRPSLTYPAADAAWAEQQRWWEQYERDDHRAATLRAWLSLRVPLRILEVRQRGGPGEEDRERIRSYVCHRGLFWGEDASWGEGEEGNDHTLLCHGAEALLFPSDFPKEQVREWRLKLADAIAVLAFAPGGVRIFGLSFDAAA